MRESSDSEEDTAERASKRRKHAGTRRPSDKKEVKYHGGADSVKGKESESKRRKAWEMRKRARDITDLKRKSPPTEGENKRRGGAEVANIKSSRTDREEDEDEDDDDDTDSDADLRREDIRNRSSKNQKSGERSDTIGQKRSKRERTRTPKRQKALERQHGDSPRSARQSPGSPKTKEPKVSRDLGKDAWLTDIREESSSSPSASPSSSTASSSDEREEGEQRSDREDFLNSSKHPESTAVAESTAEDGFEPDKDTSQNEPEITKRGAPESSDHSEKEGEREGGGGGGGRGGEKEDEDLTVFM